MNIKTKSKCFALILVLSIVMSSLYGILHDQITYTISPEYYTRFKFFQFDILNTREQTLPFHNRWYVIKVGFLATWWVGIPIGVVVGFIGWYRSSSLIKMIQVSFQAILLILGIAITTAGIGAFIGKYFLTIDRLNWWFPPGLIDQKNFIIVGSIHNYSYIGGFIGLIIASIYTYQRYKHV